MPVCLAATAVILFLTTPSHAYLDPATGSIIVQAVLGTIAAAGATMAYYWRQIRDRVSAAFKRKPRK